MPNGQGGAGWSEQESLTQWTRQMEVEYERENALRREAFRRQQRESIEQRMQRQWNAQRREDLRRQQEFYHTPIYNNTLSGSVVVTGGEWFSSSFVNDTWARVSPKPKPKHPKRPVSAIFYTMVNECGY